MSLIRASFVVKRQRIGVGSAEADGIPGQEGSPGCLQGPSLQDAPQPRRATAKKATGDWILGPYGDLMSRADYDAMMRQQQQQQKQQR